MELRTGLYRSSRQEATGTGSELWSSLGSQVLARHRAIHNASPRPYRDGIASLTGVLSLVPSGRPPAQDSLLSWQQGV